MLKVREHACIDILETLARFAGNCSADTRKIIVVCRDARRRTARPEEGEIIGFDQHLEESIIPANADAILRWTRDALTDALVARSDALKPRCDFRRRLVSSIALGNKLHVRFGLLADISCKADWERTGASATHCMLS